MKTSLKIAFAFLFILLGLAAGKMLLSESLVAANKAQVQGSTITAGEDTNLDYLYYLQEASEAVVVPVQTVRIIATLIFLLVGYAFSLFYFNVRTSIALSVAPPFVLPAHLVNVQIHAP